MDSRTYESQPQPDLESPPVSRSLPGAWLVGLFTPILVSAVWTLVHVFAGPQRTWRGQPDLEGFTLAVSLFLGATVAAFLGLLVNLIVLVLITYSVKKGSGRFPYGLLLVTNFGLLVLVFGWFGFLSTPDSAPVALVLLGGASVSAVPTLVWWFASWIADPRKRRAFVWSGMAVVASAVVALSVLRVDRPPEYPSLAASPDNSIPGTVAYVYPVSDEGDCIYTVPAAGGEPKQIVCADREIKRFGWVSNGRILIRWKVAGEPFYVQIDAETGEQISSVPVADVSKTDRRRIDPALNRWSDRKKRADGAVLRGNDYDVIVRYPEGGKKTILKRRDNGSNPYRSTRLRFLDYRPNTYSFLDPRWAPDGEWVLVSDAAGRLLVVAADGDPSARVLVVEGPTYPLRAWFIPGNPTYTVNKKDVPS